MESYEASELQRILEEAEKIIMRQPLLHPPAMDRPEISKELRLKLIAMNLWPKRR